MREPIIGPAMYNILNNQKDPEREEGNFSWHWVAKWIWPQNNLLLLSAGFFPSTFLLLRMMINNKVPSYGIRIPKKYPGRRRRRRRKRVGKNHQCRGKLALSPIFIYFHIYPGAGHSDPDCRFRNFPRRYNNNNINNMPLSLCSWCIPLELLPDS